MAWPVVAAAGIAGLASMFGQDQTNRSNETMSRDQMNFQERMSNTAVQRAMADMKAAGINPMMAAGNQASSPTGAMAVMENSLGQGISSAMEARKLAKELDATESQVTLNAASAEAAHAQSQQAMANASVAKKEAQMMDMNMPAVAQEAKVRRIHGEIDEKAAPADAVIRRVREGAGAVGSVFDVLKPRSERGKVKEDSSRKSSRQSMPRL